MDPRRGKYPVGWSEDSVEVFTQLPLLVSLVIIGQILPLESTDDERSQSQMVASMACRSGHMFPAPAAISLLTAK